MGVVIPLRFFFRLRFALALTLKGVAKMMELRPKSTDKFLRNLSLLSIMTITVLGSVSSGIGKVGPDGKRGLRTLSDVEIRCEFYPTGPYYDDSVAPTFIVIAQDGRTRALQYQLRDQTKNVSSYEGVLPSDDVQRLFARVEAGFRLPKHRKDYDRRLIYESDGFYLALKQRKAKIKEMSGGLETKPEEVRALVREMSELWKKLKEVKPAYAYLTARPVEKDRLRRLKREGPSRMTAIESLPAGIQSLLIRVVTQPLDFYPLIQPQHDQIKTYKQPVTYKGTGYELSLFQSAKESEAQHPRKSVQPKQSKAEKQSAWIVFDYTPGVLDSNFEKSEFAFVAINTDGSAQAVRYGPYNPAIIGVYEGKLPKAEVSLLLDKVRMIIPTASEIAKPYVGSCDSDSFQLSITSQRSTIIQSKIPDFACLPVMPKEIFELAQEMRTVWQRLSKVPLAYGYLRRSPFEEYLLKSAEQSSSQLIAVSKLSRDRQAAIRNAIKHSPKFYALSRVQYDQLKALTRYPSHPFDFDAVVKGRGYSLTLWGSRKIGAPRSKENRIDEKPTH
jgi:hypothetical protein